MAEEIEKKKEKAEKKPKREEPNVKAISLIRILSTDIPGTSSLYSGLTRIKGVSWAIANAACISLNMNKNKKIQDLSADEIAKISAFLKNPAVPSWMLNRKNDRETGVSKHLVTTDLDLAKDFDIRRMKKIKSYKGYRHAIGQPVRGQRTRSHFRKGSAIGVAKGKAAKAAAAPPKAKEAKK